MRTGAAAPLPASPVGRDLHAWTVGNAGRRKARYAPEIALLGLSNAQAKFAKWLLRQAGNAIPAGLAWLSGDLLANTEAPSTLEWRRFVQTWTRTTPAGTSEDKAQFKLDLLNVTADELDVSWIAGDYTAVAARFSTFRTAVNAYFGANQSWSELKAYRMKFNPVNDVLKPFAETGPPVYLAATALTMAGSAHLPYQASAATTFRTSWPRHWGRAYMPTPYDTSLDTNARFTSTFRTALQGGMATMLGGLHDDGFYPVIPVGQLDKSPFHALLAVTGVVVDDIPDVQRRRRPKQVLNRTGP